MIELDKLIVTQEDLRNWHQIPEMIQFVKNKGVFNQLNIGNEKLIKLTEFPDKQLYIHDGHHRCFSIYHAGRDFLYPEEYVIEHWTYEQYNKVNPPIWLTPFDPRIEVRLPQFIIMKEELLVTKNYNCLAENKHLYVKPRRKFRISEIENDNL